MVPCPDLLFTTPCAPCLWHAVPSRGLPRGDPFRKHLGEEFFLPFRCESLKCGRAVASRDALHRRFCLFAGGTENRPLSRPSWAAPSATAASPSVGDAALRPVLLNTKHTAGIARGVPHQRFNCAGSGGSSGNKYCPHSYLTTISSSITFPSKSSL